MLEKKDLCTMKFQKKGLDVCPDSLAFKCPCGCDTTIFLNLLFDAKPRWKYYITKKGNISISPSVWRKVGCKSHFYIRESRISWCNKN